MKTHIAAVAFDGNKVTKYQDFDTEVEAKDHAVMYGGFAAPKPSDTSKYWVANTGAKTLTHDQAQQDADIAAAPGLAAR